MNGKSLKFAIAVLALLILGALGVWRLGIFGGSLDVVSSGSRVLGDPFAGPSAVGTVTMNGAGSTNQGAAGGAGVSDAGAAHMGETATGSSNGVAAAEQPTNYTLEQFQELTSKTFRDLPTSAQMRDLTEEQAHGYPEPLAKAGPALGRIAQAVHDQPALAGAASEFYIRCAQDADVLAPVRALCYSQVLKDPKAPPAQSLPPEVVRLAHLIPAAAEDGAPAGK